jgi:hypothetical protein
MVAAYRVQSEFGLIHMCTFGGLTSLQPHGARSITTLSVNTAVLYVMYPQSHYGLIIATEPEYTLNPLNHKSDYVSQGSNAGIFTDAAHSAMITNMYERGGIPTWTAGRPLDSTSVGEWGAMTETGLGVFLDPFLGYFRVDEETGLFLFYHDQLARLAGHNLQIRASHFSKEFLNDQLEGHIVEGDTPFYWEALGGLRHTDVRHREYAPELTQTSNTEYSLFEPKFDDQQAFYRRLRYGGYLGQGWKEMICAPPIAHTGVPNRYSVDSKFLGLLNIQASLDGSYAIQSAKQIYIGKRITIPVPKQRKRAEDNRGDNESNYAACGTIFDETTSEDVEIHTLPDNLDFDDSTGPEHLVRASAVLDLIAFNVNWKGLHPFHYHRADWYIPEECDLDNNTTQDLISFCSLQSNQFLDLPTAFTRRIDDRQTAVKYYKSESYITMLEDGGVCIGDGYGSEIKMTGGSVFISAPGDIFLQPGKNLNCWAGWDAIIRAYNAADVTTSAGDVRIKAENNLMCLAGNNTYGGMLFEARSAQAAYDFSKPGAEAKTSGIIFKSVEAPIVTIGNEVVIDIQAGEDTEDSGFRIKTDCDIKFQAKNIISFIEDSRIDYIGDSVNEYWDTHALFGSNVRVSEQLVIGNGVTLKGWLSIIDGHIMTEEAFDQSEAGNVCGIPVYPLDETKQAQATLNTTYTETRLAYLEAIQNSLKITDRSEELDTAAEDAEFSLRTSADYKTTSFILFENRWQQLARLGSGIPATWSEPAVLTSSGNTYPHPGKTALIDSLSWFEQDLTLHSIPAGASLDREFNQIKYEDAGYGLTNTKTLNANYPIIRLC